MLDKITVLIADVARAEQELAVANDTAVLGFRLYYEPPVLMALG